MGIGYDASSPELILQRLVELLREDLSPIVFKDDPVTKMRVSFRYRSEAIQNPGIRLSGLFLSVGHVERGEIAQKTSQHMVKSHGSASRSIVP
jgi:hypothetical protein